MTKNYVAYHLHTTLSLFDSVTWFEDYVKRAKELGMTAIGCSEHYHVMNSVKKKGQAEKAGLKYLYGVEMGVVENLEDRVRGAHIVMYARNLDGVKELNRLVTISNDDKHSYYNPRISYDEFLSTSDNIISTSACLGGVFKRLDESHPMFIDIVNKLTFLEIQPYDHPEQIALNKRLYEYSIKYGKPLIMGTDVHALDEYALACRKMLMKSRDMPYIEEDEWKLVLHSYDELLKLATETNSLPEDVIVEAIDNTNIFAEMIEEFEYDKSFKYPDLYENEDELLRKLTEDGYEELKRLCVINDGNEKEYMEHKSYELDVLIEQGMSSFLIFLNELLAWCREVGIAYGPGRGSVAGSMVAYLLRITDVDPVVWNTVFSRFCNSERISLADVDLDFEPSKRHLVYEYIQKRFGEDRTAYISTIGTLADKGAIDTIGRALKMSIPDVAKIKTDWDNALIAEDPEKEKNKVREENKELFYYFDGFLGCAQSFGVHPAGMIASPITLSDNLGLIWNSRKGVWASQADMKCVDGLNYVKYDILGLKNIEIISDTLKSVGQSYKFAHEFDWNDKDVWRSITESPVGIFQFEGQFAFDLLKRFLPEKVDDLSLINASLRPSGASYRDKVVDKTPAENPNEDIDELLKASLGYLVFQEQQSAFLQKMCGFTAGRADSIRRAVGKKDKELLDSLLPEIKEGYMSNSKQPKDVTEKEIESFLTVFVDSADYAFGFNHSTAYSMIGYMCAYLRHYYPVEFATAYLNNASNEDDIINGTALCKLKDIDIRNPEFGVSVGKYSTSNGVIYKGVGSVLNVSENCSNDLYELYPKVANLTFTEVLDACLSLRSTDTRKIRTLIRIDYFKRYGKRLKLDKFFEYFEKYKDKKQIKKDSIPAGTEKLILRMIKNEVEGFSETKALYKIDYIVLLKEMFKCIKDEDFSDEDKLMYELSYLGYVQSDIKIEYATVKYLSFKNSSYCLEYKGGATKWLKLREGLTPLNKGDIIAIHNESKGYIVSYTKIGG